MIIASIVLIVLGLVAALLGFKLFRILLPLVGFVSGLMVGFTGFQGVFGKGAVSTTLAIVVALIVGVLLAVLAFAFFELALVVIAAIVGASALSFLGVALGLDKEGFIVFMLALAGGILAAWLAIAYPIGASFVMVLTSAFGVAVLLSGVMLLVGDVSLDELNNNGIIPTVREVVDQSFLWFLAWIGGTLLAVMAQTRLLMEEVIGDNYQFEIKKSSK